MKKDEREKLEAVRDELDELLENDEEDTAERVKPQRSVFRMRFSEVQKMLDAGLADAFQLGDEIWNENPMAAEPICWIVIGRDEESVTLWAVQGLARRPFDEKSEKKYPYGHALWRDCSLRGWMNGELLSGFAPEDAAAIATVKKITVAPDQDGGLIETEDKLWLLSATEAGFAPDRDWSLEEGTAYPYFIRGSEARQIGEWWFLRSAYRGYANYAWSVNTSGYAHYYYATYAHRPAPACVIRKS